MAKLGSFEYPEIPLSESIDLGQRIAREFAGEVSRHGLARALGMSERGGAFAARLGALRMWGIATGRSRIRVSRDGLRASSPLSPQESESARKALASSVPLFVELSARTGDGPYDHARLAVLVEELTGEGRQEVARRLPLLDRIFSEVRQYLSSSAGRRQQGRAEEVNDTEAQLHNAADPVVSEPRQTPPRAVDRPVGGRVAAGGEDRIELILPDGALSLPETVNNLDAALTVLWARRQLVAAYEAAKGRPAPTPPREFTRDATRQPRPTA